MNVSFARSDGCTPSGPTRIQRCATVNRRAKVDRHQQQDREKEQHITESLQEAVVERRRQKHDGHSDHGVGHLLVQETSASFHKFLYPRIPIHPNPTNTKVAAIIDQGNRRTQRAVFTNDSLSWCDCPVNGCRRPLDAAHSNFATYIVYYGYVNCDKKRGTYVAGDHSVMSHVTKNRYKVCVFRSLRYLASLPRLLAFCPPAAILLTVRHAGI